MIDRQVRIILQEHCDFMLLYKALFSSTGVELRQQTANLLYENYRAKKLSFLAAIDEVKLSETFILQDTIFLEHGEYSQ